MFGKMKLLLKADDVVGLVQKFRCPVARLLCVGSALGMVVFPRLTHAASRDAEIDALRSQVAAMRQELQELRREIHGHAGRSEAAGRVASRHVLVARHGQSASHGSQKNEQQDPDVVPVFSQAHEISIIRKNGSSGHKDVVVVDQPAMSWADFRAAVAADEELQVGGMRIGFPQGRPTIASVDGKYAFSIGLLLQEDIGGFLNTAPKAGETKGNFNSLTENLRRLRLYLSWRYGNWVARFTPEFGSGTHDGDPSLTEASLNYTGLKNTVLTAGYIIPTISLESASRSGGFELLERSTIVDLMRNIAGGMSRFSVGGETHNRRMLAALYLTGQKFGDRSKDTTITDSQTGMVARIATRPVITKNVDVYVGAGASVAFRLNKGSGGRSYTFQHDSEVPLGETNLLTSGKLTNVAQIWSLGPQFALRWNRLLLKSEYYHIGVERSHKDGIVTLPTLGFDGWYVSANYVIMGKPRRYDVRTAGFVPPGIVHEFDPANNYWGALEISGRWSVTDLNGAPGQGGAGINGNQQTVWMTGINWYPTTHLRFMLDYNHFIVSQSLGVSQGVNRYGRSGDGIVGRVQVAF